MKRLTLLTNPEKDIHPTELDLCSEHQLVGESPLIIRITESLKKIATTDCTSLITGETGTGKELAAKLIHRHSPRSQKPFVVINCSAIPDTLLESELFGHERGAFTGAVAKREGAILSANHGTVFFDEIGDMSQYAQAKLLRTIENKEVWPVGGKRSLLVDTRFIAATNRDLEQLMKEGKFRADLYYRLNVARILLPPLRERQGDIALLLDYFRERYNRQFGKKVEGFTEEAVTALVDYDWPGNIRELKNLMEASFIHAEQRISLEDLPEGFRQRLRENETLGQDERTRLITALLNSNWNKAKAAQRLKWSRMTLYRKMAKYGVPSASGIDQEITLQ
jgi:transcriptional regulator with PAS, ATPase and Fis domain